MKLLQAVFHLKAVLFQVIKRFEKINALTPKTNPKGTYDHEPTCKFSK